ncbi:MAG: polymerase sigma factor [Proteobacteria bacterium]|nr:polymerase sigma factor [Pseudomonadota bacterium]
MQLDEPLAVENANEKDETGILFRLLVNDNQKRLYRFILKNIGNSADAEDLMQQTFLEAARAYATFRGESALSTWLYGIAMNLTRNYLSRSVQRKYKFEDEESLANLASETPDPSEALAQRQAVNLLQAELADLPGEMREVLLLVALDEVSYEEASVMLSIPLGTVRSRVSRARSRLRRRMEDAGIELDFQTA